MKFKSLTKAAKQRAIDWWFKGASADWDGREYYDDLLRAMALLGYDVDVDRKADPDFRWSGFYSQGDGFAFAGRWKATDLRLGELAKGYPLDQELQRTGAQLQAVALKHPDGTCRIEHYGHSSMRIDETETGGEDDEGMDNAEHAILKEAADDIANWCWGQLRAEYEYATSDEAAIDSIEANEYNFDREGNVRTTRANRLSAGAAA